MFFAFWRVFLCIGWIFIGFYRARLCSPATTVRVASSCVRVCVRFSGIVSRVHSLKGSKVRYKKKALVDHLKFLKGVGLSHHVAERANLTNDLPQLFQY